MPGLRLGFADLINLRALCRLAFGPLDDQIFH